jgi:tetratricopeptide (TPR) repeat protein
LRLELHPATRLVPIPSVTASAPLASFPDFDPTSDPKVFSMIARLPLPLVLAASLLLFGVHAAVRAQESPAPPQEKPAADAAVDPAPAEKPAEPAANAEAPEAGQEDLDKATITKLTAKSMADLESVVELCESALKKGLDEGNQKYARDLMTATLYDQATRLSRLIFDQQPVDPRWPNIRDLAMARLTKAVEIRPEMGNVHLLIARLQGLPNGDRDQAKTSAEKALTLLADDPSQLSLAYQARAALAEKPESMLEDLAKAIELDQRNLDAWRMRGVYYLTQGEFEKALADFQQLLERDPEDMAAHQAIAQTFRAMKQYDKALDHLKKVTEADPQASLAYTLRAQILEEQGDLAGAVESLNDAVKAQPRDIGALLSRARLRTAQEQFDLARSDLERALEIRPGLPQAILLRSLISAAQDRFGAAIGDIQQLLRQAPDNEDLKLQLGTYYEGDKRPRRAIELYSELLKGNQENWQALRRRGDAYLSIGQHADAIRDYDAALKLQENETGVLNNLAWVLATSPDDNLRDGKRALELAKKACELTEYKAPHIISTLAACHAEAGDFDEAIRVSQKAVEDDQDQQKQLQSELDAYKERKPWREKQLTEENTADLEARDAAEDDLPGSPTNESDVLEDLEKKSTDESAEKAGEEPKADAEENKAADDDDDDDEEEEEEEEEDNEESDAASDKGARR